MKNENKNRENFFGNRKNLIDKNKNNIKGTKDLK
jgi:hypothetical protein